MAEQVQAILDRMVPSLKILLDNGIFSESEIKAIVSRRRESEYLLHRRAARKSDYARYIEAEENLDKLRNLRTKKVLARLAAKEREEHQLQQKKQSTNNIDDTNTTTKKTAKSMGDSSIVQHIHFIFVRAKRKWKDDLTWHIQHAEYAKRAKSFQMLGKIYAEALQVHPRNTSLWIESASHEFFGYIVDEKSLGMSGGGSIKNARVLLQRGIRINRDAQDLWLQWFSLELHYVQKLRGRKLILNGDLGSSSDKNNTAEIDDEEEHYDSNEDDGMDGMKDSTMLDDELKIPRIIYKNAIKNIPHNVAFRLQFIDSCNLFPHTNSMIDEIMQSIKDDFDSVPDGWIARVKYLMEKQFFKGDENQINSTVGTNKKRKSEEMDGSAVVDLNAILQLLEESTTCISTSEMFEKAVTFLKEYFYQLCNYLLNNKNSDGAEEDDTVFTNYIENVTQCLQSLLKKAEKNELITPTLVIESATLLNEVDLKNDAIELLEKFSKSNVKCQRNGLFWLCLTELYTNSDNGEQDAHDKKNTFVVLRRALNHIPIDDTKTYCSVASHLFMNILHFMTDSSTSSAIVTTTDSPAKVTSQNKYDSELSKLFEKILLLNTSINKNQHNTTSMTVASISVAYLDYLTNYARDYKGARSVYNKVLFGSNYLRRGVNDENRSFGEDEIESIDTFFKNCITLEQKMAFDGGSKDESKKTIVRIFKIAIDFFERMGTVSLSDWYMKSMNKYVTL